MAIDRIASGNPVPLITQRFDVSPATPMVPGVVQPLVPIGPYMAPAPDAGTLPAQLQQKGQDSLASLIKPNAEGRAAPCRATAAPCRSPAVLHAPADLATAQRGAAGRFLARDGQTYGRTICGPAGTGARPARAGHMVMAEQQRPAARSEPVHR